MLNNISFSFRIPPIFKNTIEMDSYESAAAAVCVNALISTITIRKRRRRKDREVWTHDWLKKRTDFGAYNCLISEIRASDRARYRNFMRMDAETFDELHNLVAPMIIKKDTNFRMAVPTHDRLAVTLRFMATGETFRSLSYLFRISNQLVGEIVIETAGAISKALEGYIKAPETEEEWRLVEKEFQEKWNFEHCCGALDGKHVALRPPAHSGSYFYNYKGNFSIVLLALVDANCKFLVIDLGCNGRISDGGVLKNSQFGKDLLDNKIPLPPKQPLTGRSKPTPYIFVADGAFPLTEHLMKPYSRSNLDVPTRIFNYRLSRARRVSENAFGILANRFRVLLSRMLVSPEKAEVITMSACCLHNYLGTKISNQYMPSGSLDTEDLETHEIRRGTWRTEPTMTNIDHQHMKNPTKYAKSVRDELCLFFNSSGQVPWQWNMI